ncbi:hypothetical protein ACFVIY_33620 [Streptomyces sp. NPDC127166]|uniref:hypothetical protein n=1 Tax=Streptomyces sp. NPDC127166 TaxID=3345380 RepID=UPI0036260039
MQIAGSAHWSLEDVDLLAAHYGLAVLDLLAGPTHAVGVLHDAARSLKPGALTVSPVRQSAPVAPTAPSAPDRPTAETHPKSQKGADEIWEGRPKWRNAALVAAARKGEEFEVTALDMNAAYLSALKAWLPIGQLREDTSGVHDPKKAGVHLITPVGWDHMDLSNPLGNRMEPGELWVSESTLRLLLDCAAQGLADPRSSTAPSSPAPRKPSWRRCAARSRKSAGPRWPRATSSPSPT